MYVTRYLITALVVFTASCDKKNDQTAAENKPADNTEKNERDRNDSAQTPGDQQENKQDIEITAAIRKGVVGDDSLSMNAKNVKIITADGVVTLRGPVKSETEKTTIATLAQNTAGVQRVDNQLEIAAQ